MDGAQNILARDHAEQALPVHDHEPAARGFVQEHPRRVIDIHRGRHFRERRGHEVAHSPADHVTAAALGQKPEAVVLRQLADHVSVNVVSGNS